MSYILLSLWSYFSITWLEYLVSNEPRFGYWLSLHAVFLAVHYMYRHTSNMLVNTIVLIAISFLGIARAARSCSPARLNFNIPAQGKAFNLIAWAPENFIFEAWDLKYWLILEFRVRGLDLTPGRRTITVNCTRDDVTEAFEETLKLTYETISRCAPLNSSSNQGNGRNIAQEAQDFADTGLRIANDRVAKWAARRNAKLSTLPQFFYSKSSLFIVIDPVEGNYNFQCKILFGNLLIWL